MPAYMWTDFSSLPSLSNQGDVKYYSDTWLFYTAIRYRYIDKQFYSLYKNITRYHFFYYNFSRQTARTGPLILWLRSVDGASYLFAPGSSPHRSLDCGRTTRRRRYCSHLRPAVPTCICQSPKKTPLDLGVCIALAVSSKAAHAYIAGINLCV